MGENTCRRGNAEYKECLMGAINCVAPLFEKTMKTTYAPKFPDVKSDFELFLVKTAPLLNYERLIRERNLKVSIGDKLDYGK